MSKIILWSNEMEIELWAELQVWQAPGTAHQPCYYYPYSEAWWWQYHAMRIPLSFSASQHQGQGDWSELSEIWLKVNKSLPKVKITCSRVHLTWKWSNGSSFSITMTPSILSRKSWNGWSDKKLIVVEWPSKPTDPKDHLWRELKVAVHKHFPSDPMEISWIS